MQETQDQSRGQEDAPCRTQGSQRRHDGYTTRSVLYWGTRGLPVILCVGQALAPVPGTQKALNSMVVLEAMFLKATEMAYLLRSNTLRNVETCCPPPPFTACSPFGPRSYAHKIGSIFSLVHTGCCLHPEP